MALQLLEEALVGPIVGAVGEWHLYVIPAQSRRAQGAQREASGVAGMDEFARHGWRLRVRKWLQLRSKRRSSSPSRSTRLRCAWRSDDASTSNRCQSWYWGCDMHEAGPRLTWQRRTGEDRCMRDWNTRGSARACR